MWRPATTSVATFELGTDDVSTSTVAAAPLGDGGRVEADDKGLVWGSMKKEKLERLRAKRRQERHQRKNKNQAAKHQDDGVDGAAAADGAGDGAVAPMSLDGVAAADGAADGAVALWSLAKERRRQ